MYRLTTISRNALGEQYERTWSVAYSRKESAVRTGDNLVEDGIEGFGCVIGYRITTV